MQHRFFIPPENFDLNGGKALVTGEEARHISRVLRLKAGEELVLADGRGRAFLGRLAGEARGTVLVDLLHPLEEYREPPLELTLGQSLLKGEKMDLVVQKSTELGVTRVIPLITERTVVRLDPRKAPGKVSRWQKIARGAAAQSHRSRVPRVEGPRSLEEFLVGWVAGDARGPGGAGEPRQKGGSGDMGGGPGEDPGVGAGLKLFLWEEERGRSLKGALRAAGLNREARGLPGPAAKGLTVTILVGPEGGFSPAEACRAAACGALPVSLGPRILRAETAALAAITMALYELGDLGGTHG